VADYDLTESARGLLPELFTALPLSAAMPSLSPRRANLEFSPLVAQAVCDRRVARSPELAACLWLYVDDLEAAHAIVQNLSSPAADWIHAIVHRREGDLGNSDYWYRRAANHPRWQAWTQTSDYLKLLSPDADEIGRLDAQRSEWRFLVEDLTEGIA